MAEWSNVPDSKSGVPQGTVGSNPTLSANLSIGRGQFFYFPHSFPHRAERVGLLKDCCSIYCAGPEPLVFAWRALSCYPTLPPPPCFDGGTPAGLYALICSYHPLVFGMQTGGGYINFWIHWQTFCHYALSRLPSGGPVKEPGTAAYL